MSEFSLNIPELSDDDRKALERALQLLAAMAKPAELETTVQPGDIAQIYPTSDPDFGGLCVRITRASPYEVRGYLLMPHRGGCQEAWYRFHQRDLLRIGRAAFPDPKPRSKWI